MQALPHPFSLKLRVCSGAPRPTLPHPRKACLPLVGVCCCTQKLQLELQSAAVQYVCSGVSSRQRLSHCPASVALTLPDSSGVTFGSTVISLAEKWEH